MKSISILRSSSNNFYKSRSNITNVINNNSRRLLFLPQMNNQMSMNIIPSFSSLSLSSTQQRNFSTTFTSFTEGTSTNTNTSNTNNIDENVPVIDADEYAEEIQAVKDEYAWRKARKQSMVGIVQSNKMNKSITVLCYRQRYISKYGVHIRRKKRVMAHDEDETALPGDVVRVVPCRPLSKKKRHTLIDIIKRADQLDI